MGVSDGRPPRATPAWMLAVKPGDRLEPDGLWNRTERRQNHLPARVVVTDVRRESNCQHGVMVRVLDVSNSPRWLSIGWFVGLAPR